MRNSFLLLAAACIWALAGQTLSAKTKTLEALPLVQTGTANQPWTVMVTREKILSTPAWSPLSKTDPPLDPESAALLAEAYVRSKGFKGTTANIALRRLNLFGDRWYYSISFDFRKDPPLGISPYNQVVLLMDGTILDPEKGALPPIYK